MITEPEREKTRIINMVGEMAAGIGHEIRNPITIVRGFMQILSCKSECTRYKEYFNLMFSELDKINFIIKELLLMSRNKKVDLKINSINAILQDIYPVIQAEAVVSHKSIDLELGEIPVLLLDEVEIQRLILNLARNGLEAMAPGKKLIVRTYREGNEVVLSVIDQGYEIDPAILEKMGIPFFTTKDRSTGLGLAVCYSIAARHNAVIKVETYSAGTTFFIRFMNAS